MKTSMKILLLVAVGLFGITLGVIATQAEAAEYVGAKKCKICHNNAKLGGEQYKVWEKSKHAIALETLKNAGAADNPKCLKCHMTGYGKSAAPEADLTGVQCEACHGPGSDYKSFKIMSKKAFKADPEAARLKAVEAGLIFPPTEAVCRGCHNEESPLFKAKGFDFPTYKEKIKHWK